MTKVDGQLKREPLRATFFVPMTGVAEQNRQVKPDRAWTELAHGSFEQTAESSDEPAGWFYVRQARVAAEPQAPAGERYVIFSNSTPGRSAHAMQAFGVDGRTVRLLEVSLWVRGNQLRPGPTEGDQPKAIVEFYDANRAPVRHEGLGPWSGSFDWKRQSTRMRVPPTARLAVVGIGLFGATGQLALDDVQLTASP
jgi:protein-L-isoaspartate(D-aspartate) O-methyltransferase